MERQVQLNKKGQRNSTTLCLATALFALLLATGLFLLVEKLDQTAVICHTRGMCRRCCKSDTKARGEAWQQGSQRGTGPQRDSMYAGACASGDVSLVADGVSDTLRITE